jgi:hypothetical protein
MAVARIDMVVPAERELLCEGCGYILGGLPESGNCPECGRPIVQSRGDHRRLSRFEATPLVGALLRTALAALLRPGWFFRTLATRPADARAAAWFARCHRAFAAALLSVACCGLVMIDRRFPRWLNDTVGAAGPDAFRIDLYVVRLHWGDEPVVFGLLLLPVLAIIYVLIALGTAVAVRVIAWLGTERGVRLQPDVARRTLGFHSVHLAPAAFLVAATVGGPFALQVTPLAIIAYVVFAQLASWLAARGSVRPHRTATERAIARSGFVAVTLLMAVIVAWYFDRFDGPYFDRLADAPADWRMFRYTLAAGAVIGLSYLLLTGWIAIRNTMYANDRRVVLHAS